MNQILITGEEPIIEMAKAKKEKKPKKEKKVISIKAISVFYAICIIILGISMICGSVYARDQINKTVEANMKPEVTLERNDEDNTILISVKHIRGIKNVTYQWNEDEEIVINTNDSKEVNETINLIGGRNVLKVTAIDESGKTGNLSKVFTADNIPTIKIVGAVENGIKVEATSEEGIDYIQYSWDDGEIQKIKEFENENKYEGIINAPRGRHTIKMEIIDKKGIKTVLERDVVGDTEPTLKITAKDNEPIFVIDAEDDEGIKQISIIHNAGKEQITKVKDKKYHQEIVMTEGEINTLIVVVTNINGVQNIKGVKYSNK